MSDPTLLADVQAWMETAILMVESSEVEFVPEWEGRKLLARLDAALKEREDEARMHVKVLNDAVLPDHAPADHTPLVRALVAAVNDCHPQLLRCAPGAYLEYHISDPGYWDDIVLAARALVAAWPEVGG